MKNIFKYVGIIALMCFSFYYTKEAAEFMRKDDAVMRQINEYASTHNRKCVEGYITEKGVVLGISGLIVDENLSYSMMKGSGFNESLIKYKDNPCVVTLDNNKKDYIIAGNPSKNSVSLIINITNGKSIEDIISVTKYKDVRISLLADYIYLDKNKDLVAKLLKDNYDFLYKGDNDEDLSKYLKTFQEIDKSKKTFCVSLDNNVLEYCYKKDLNTIKSDKIYKSKYLSNIKRNLSKGDIIILDESSNLKTEIGVIINYIKSRGLKIVTVSEHLKWFPKIGTVFFTFSLHKKLILK